MKHFFVAALFLLPGISFPALAQENLHPEISSKFSLDLGMFYPEREIKLQAGASAGGARKIDFGSEFGLEKHDQTFAIDFRWRFGEKWSLSAQHFQASGQRTLDLDENVEWNGLVFSRGTTVEASTEFALYRVLVGRSFAKSDNLDFGFGAGIHWLELSADIAGNVLVNNSIAFRRESVSSSAPLPNIGAWYQYSLSPRWAIKARADWFKASVDEYDGRLVNVQAGVNFALFRHGGIGVAYNHFELDAGVDAGNWQGAADLIYKGPFVFVNAYW